MASTNRTRQSLAEELWERTEDELEALHEESDKLMDRASEQYHAGHRDEGNRLLDEADELLEVADGLDLEAEHALTCLEQIEDEQKQRDTQEMRIMSLWIGTVVLADGKLANAPHSVALQHADWMEITDEEGWPRVTEPGDIFWVELPVWGVDITLQEDCLVAKNAEAELRLEGVDLSTIFPAANLLQPPPQKKSQELYGMYGQGN